MVIPTRKLITELTKLLLFSALELAFACLRAMPRQFKGKARIARWLVRLGPDGERWVPGPCATRLKVPASSEPIAVSLLADGVYEPELLDFLLNTVSAGGTYLDVGANVGCFVVPLSGHVGPSGRVIAVEASPSVFRCLSDTIKESSASNVHLVHAAATDQNGTTNFYEAPSEKFGMGCLAPLGDWRRAAVPARTLDSLATEFDLKEIDVIKIDVEGFEAGVIRGAEAILNRARPPIIVLEFCDWAEANAGEGIAEAQRQLLSRGFQIWTLDAYCKRSAPITTPQTEGFTTLIARREQGHT